MSTTTAFGREAEGTAMDYNTRIYVGTLDGVHRVVDGGAGCVPLGLAGHRVWALAAWAEPAGDVLLAGTYGAGVFRSADGGATWFDANTGLTAPYLRSLERDPNRPETVYAGTEPGRLFQSDDAGRTWHEITAFADVPESGQWFLPYSPRAGATRNLLLNPARPEFRFASVEVGGALLSEDAGASWRYVIGPNEDVHYVTHDSARNRLYAAMGYAGRSVGGVLRSDNEGRRWRVIVGGYTRAIIVPPGQSDTLLASPGPEVGRCARLLLTTDGGDTWTEVGDGLTMPMPDMVEVFHADSTGQIWGVCAGGRLIVADPREWRWRSLPPFERGHTAQSLAFAHDATR